MNSVKKHQQFCVEDYDVSNFNKYKDDYWGFSPHFFNNYESPSINSDSTDNRNFAAAGTQYLNNYNRHSFSPQLPEKLLTKQLSGVHLLNQGYYANQPAQGPGAHKEPGAHNSNLTVDNYRLTPNKTNVNSNLKKQNYRHASNKTYYNYLINRRILFSMNRLSIAGMVTGLMFLGALFFTSGFILAVNLYAPVNVARNIPRDVDNDKSYQMPTGRGVRPTAAHKNQRYSHHYRTGQYTTTKDTTGNVIAKNTNKPPRNRRPNTDYEQHSQFVKRGHSYYYDQAPSSTATKSANFEGENQYNPQDYYNSPANNYNHAYKPGYKPNHNQGDNSGYNSHNNLDSDSGEQTTHTAPNLSSTRTAQNPGRTQNNYKKRQQNHDNYYYNR